MTSKGIKPPMKEETEMKGIKKKKVAWKEEEDARLIKAVQEFGTDNWIAIQSTVMTRSIKECKKRYYNHLDPTIDGSGFTFEDDIIILKMVKEIGKKWIEISQHLAGKTPHQTRLHYEIDLKDFHQHDDHSDEDNDGNGDEGKKPIDGITRLIPEAMGEE
ncbi:hypothetical protein ENUP19_0051G0007 [Entamoeba nuttalli]|uniref:Myb family DNA-binding domain containing protein n=2 Tax=Entamoeba nuttalli TaxID=412467 RepID=K2HFZ9_ENTNP|nr:myb family DNA-binding domain containing protein [Entamoeba nuttalli P19]EKE41769.1 myb family DNA-binding domain containing protein [Entamoeba nuttalli P19]|eukprot:XP_008855900.1 myb family DNA-binding domain containing protein [Entamoeba nuttalli P19]